MPTVFCLASWIRGVSLSHRPEGTYFVCSVHLKCTYQMETVSTSLRVPKSPLSERTTACGFRGVSSANRRLWVLTPCPEAPKITRKAAAAACSHRAAVECLTPLNPACDVSFEQRSERDEDNPLRVVDLLGARERLRQPISLRNTESYSQLLDCDWPRAALPWMALQWAAWDRSS